jgi:CheY-like chemotaxis protein
VTEAHAGPRADSEPPRVLFVDGDSAYCRHVQALFEPSELTVSTVTDSDEALQRMHEQVPDLVVLDGDLPDTRGVELLCTMRGAPQLAQVPVVFRVTPGTSHERQAALTAGATFCVAKTQDRLLLQSAVRTALHSAARASRLREQRPSIALDLLCNGTFHFKTLNDARRLATMLSELCPHREPALLGLHELLVNAIEHGNLEISYDEKTRLCRAGTWSAEVARRLELPEYKHRVARIHARRRQRSVVFRIQDEGPGFAWSEFLGLEPQRAQDPNGRGIALARRIAFTELRYEGRGNIVTAEVRLERD